jgi:bacterioferritin-associated ferredoxin
VSWPTVLSSAIASACLVLGALHFLIWLKIRTARASLGFAVLALRIAAFTWCELAAMRADTVERFLASFRWADVATFVGLNGSCGRCPSAARVTLSRNAAGDRYGQEE